MAGFKIASGYVEVEVLYDQRKLRKEADRAGKDAGSRFSQTFSKETRNIMSGFGKRTNVFRELGEKSGKAFADSFGRSFQKELPKHLKTDVVTKSLAKDIDRTGNDLGKKFAESFGRGFEKSMPKLSVSGSGFSESGRAAGRAYASGFQEGVSGVSLRPLEDRVRATRDRIGSEGENTGNRFTRALSRTLVRGGTESMDGFRRLMSKHLDLTVGGMLLILGGLALAAPAIGAAMAAGITLAFGGGIATLGVIAAAQSDRVQNAFSRMSDNIGRDMRAMARPLEGMLVSLAGQIETTFNKLSPALSRAFSSAAPVMKEFNRQFLSAFSGWGPVIDRASGAFNRLLDALGPMIRESLGELGDEFQELFAIVEANPAPFASIIDNIIDLATWVTDLTGDLASLYVKLTESEEWNNFKSNMDPVLDSLKELGEDLAPTAEQAMKDLLNVFGDSEGDTEANRKEWEMVNSELETLIRNFNKVDGAFRVFSGAMDGSADWFHENVANPIWNDIKSTFFNSDWWSQEWTQFGSDLQGIGSALNPFANLNVVDRLRGIRNDGSNTFFNKEWWSQEWSTFGSDLGAIGNALNPFDNLNIGAQISNVLTNTGLSGKLSSWWNTEWTTFKSQVGDIGGWFSEKFSSIKTTASSTWNSIASTVSSHASTMVGNVQTGARNLGTNLSTRWDGIKSNAYDKWNAFSTNVGNIFGNWRTGIQNTGRNLGTNLSSRWDSVKSTAYDKWNAFSTNVGNIVSSWGTGIRRTASNVGTNLSNRWDSVKSTAYDKWNAFSTNVGNIVSSWGTGIRRTASNVGTNLSNRWDSVKSTAYDKWNSFKTNVGNIADSWKTRVQNTARNLGTNLSNRWDNIKSNASTKWNTVKNTIVDKSREFKDKGLRAARDFRDGFIDAFNRTKTGFERVWNRIKKVAAEPVNFMIKNVYNDGIRILWSKIADHVPGLGYLKAAPMIKFATGGVMPGYTPGRDVHTVPGPNGSVGLSGGEAIMRPEWTRAIGADNVHRMNRVARSGGVSGVRRALGIGEGFAAGGVASQGDVSRNIRKGNFGEKTPVLEPGEGFALGGIVGDWARRTFANVKDFTQDKLGDIVGWASKPFKDAFNSLRGGDSGGSTKKTFPGVPYHAGQRLWEKIKSLFQSKDDEHNAASGSGWTGAKGTLKAAVEFAKSQHGKKYQWGGNGNPSWDCSGYLSAIESVIRGQKPHRRWSTHAFQSRGPSGWERDLDSPFMIGITHRGVGHTAGTLMGNKVESAGGGKGVRFNRGALGHDNKMFQSKWGFHPAISKAKRAGGGGSGNTMMTSFWDSHQPMANGKRMHNSAIASSVIPLGTKLQVKVGGKTATGSVDDLGPASFVYRRHHPKALLDLAEPMMQKLTGRRSNTVNGSFNVLKRGSGRTLFGYTNWNGKYSPGRSTRGFDLGGIVGGTPMGMGSHDVGGMLPDRHVAHNRSGEAEMVATLSQLEAIVAAQQNAGDTFSGDIYVTIDAKNVKDFQDVVKVVKGVKQAGRANGGNVRFQVRD
ncbi:hypothetical protein NGM33_09210 [Nocardiopsis dassonvillei]|uniref:hypothetical protein n=1 Tax=Nocardiopsis dassonvillei TaxID=2014 RepID=UPI0020A59E7F|nr:hypothetical protein [Nocardiopsis dassonvillei]MCP3013512.1 hypothetical protein [Nocardiopsis dassonvillei]